MSWSRCSGSACNVRCNASVPPASSALLQRSAVFDADGSETRKHELGLSPGLRSRDDFSRVPVHGDLRGTERRQGSGLLRPDVFGAPKPPSPATTQADAPEAAGPDNAKPCSKTKMGALVPIVANAKDMAFDAFMAVQSRRMGPFYDPTTDTHLFNHFKIGLDLKNIGTVANVLRDAYFTLSGHVQFLCASEKDPNCERFGAYVTKSHPGIFLCPSFWNHLDEHSPWTVLHEAAHLGGAWKDNTYFITFGESPACDEASPLDNSKAIENADSYSYFAYCVSRGKAKARPKKR